MVILEFIVSVLYVVLFIALVLIVIALAIPVGILYVLYWILFRSWRKKPRKEVVLGTTTRRVKSKDIKNLVSKAIKSKNNSEDFDEDEFSKEVNAFVTEVTGKEKE